MNFFVVWGFLLACGDATKMEEMEERINDLEEKVQRLEEKSTQERITGKRAKKTKSNEESEDFEENTDESPNFFPLEQIKSVEKGTYSIPQSVLDSMKEHPEKLSTQVRLLPHENEGVIDGCRMTGIRGKSVFWKMGFKNGDILHKINDTPISSMQELQKAYISASGSKNLTVHITRRREPMVLTYTIE